MRNALVALGLATSWDLCLLSKLDINMMIYPVQNKVKNMAINQVAPHPSFPFVVVKRLIFEEAQRLLPLDHLLGCFQTNPDARDFDNVGWLTWRSWTELTQIVKPSSPTP